MVEEDKIIYAISNQDTKYISYFINTFGVNYQIKSQDNDSLISYALSDSGSESYKLILEYLPDLKLINDEGENIIHSIVYSGVVERLSFLEYRLLNLLNEVSSDGTTPLLLAIILDKEDIAVKLIEMGANINIPDHKLVLPIHAAAINGNLHLVERLIKLGADLNAKTLSGNNALALAANHLYKDVIRFLFESIFNERLINS